MHSRNILKYMDSGILFGSIRHASVFNDWPFKHLLLK